MIEISEAATAGQLESAKEMVLEYARSLEFDLDFQDFEEEVSRFPGEYAPPGGRILLALSGGEAAGIVAMHRSSPGVCEMKRLFVRPRFRGLGIGKALALRIIEESRKVGYSKMRLDTLSSMKEATALYLSLGFYEIEPYRFNPLGDAVFMELTLD